MGANGKSKTYVQAGIAMVTPEVNRVIQSIATSEDRPIARVIRQFIEEHPRVKAALKGGSNAKKGK